MRRYGTSKFRLLLLAVLLSGAWVVTSGHAQDVAPAADGPGSLQLVFSLVRDNIDFVFIIIAVLSVAAVTLIIQGFIKNRESVYMPPETVQRIRSLIEARQFGELEQFTAQNNSFIAKVIHPAVKRLPSFTAMKESLETAIGEQTAEQFRRIEYLNIIGNLGPLLGLLGTVLGMIEAFTAVQVTGGQARVADLAAGISKALAHTFLGLLLAVPALAAFGVLRTLVDRLTVRGALLAEELLLSLRPGEAKAAVPAPAAGAAKPALPPLGAVPPAGARRAPTA